MRQTSRGPLTLHWKKCSLLSLVSFESDTVTPPFASPISDVRPVEGVGPVNPHAKAPMGPGPARSSAAGRTGIQVLLLAPGAGCALPLRIHPWGPGKACLSPKRYRPARRDGPEAGGDIDQCLGPGRKVLRRPGGPLVPQSSARASRATSWAELSRSGGTSARRNPQLLSVPSTSFCRMGISKDLPDHLFTCSPSSTVLCSKLQIMLHKSYHQKIKYLSGDGRASLAYLTFLRIDPQAFPLNQCDH
ncbi:hypothetical protein THAOC_05618 [Thalassiosira oceanica]|uniref:Uncharacterized protein n=1 Tax=Thalassiosira oceanica TaxID=159749 RepID=K0T588_THAOC|nr:hypothetical protein THAOC_05618 [Thalassiosira oceanica]|eukprot:EJK72810.1 hypothetical protein THAOC_05618 [Thalassiosira oceanica]